MLIDFLQELREAWGGPIKINSGYRCSKLNTAVGGSETSVHPLFLAADTVPLDMDDFPRYVDFVKEFVKDKEFDQLLIEKSRTTEWLHIGLRNMYGEARKQIKNLYV